MPRVTIDNTFTVEVPRGMKYSTNPNEIDGQLFAAIEDTETQTMMEDLLGMTMIQGAFMIPKGINVASCIGSLTIEDGNGEIDIYDEALRDFIVSPAQGMFKGLNVNLPKSQFEIIEYEDKNIIASYGRTQEDDTVMFAYSLIVDLKIYVGYINATDTGGLASQKAYVKKFLKSVKRIGGSSSGTKKTTNKTSGSAKPKTSKPKEKGLTIEKPEKVMRNIIHTHVDLDESDKIDGIEALQTWIGKDFFFFNDSDYSFDGKHFDIESIQLNSARMGDLPSDTDFNKISVLMKFFIDEVEKNESFICPIKDISNEVKEVVGSEGFTGLSLLLLLQEHLINIAFVSVESKDKAKNSVIISVDPIVKEGVPKAEEKIEGLIRLALEYNDNKNDFEITFYDAPGFKYDSKSGEVYEEPNEDLSAYNNENDLSTAFADYGNFADNVNKGGLYNEQGTINALIVQQLYDHDVIFNRDNEIVFDGSKNTFSGVQLNKSQVDNYPGIMNDPEHFVQEYANVLLTVEENKNLKIPKAKFHKNLLAATRNAPITGMTFFLFSQHHMMSISGNIDSDSYTVAADVDLINGVPNVSTYIGEFIKALRNYNSVYDDFSVTIAGTRNLDSPCNRIDKPVAGADASSMITIEVKGR